jgi:membrane associated rhomboid family serine protease
MWRSSGKWRTFLFGGRSPQFGRSRCTLALSAVTLVTCIVQSLIGWDPVLLAIGFVPSAVWSPSTWLSIWPGQSIPVALTWFTYVFPHAGWGHMAGNLLALLAFGGVVEPRIGTRQFVLVVISLVASSVFASAAVHPNGIRPAGGGSLLICGVFGVWLANYSQPRWESHPRSTLALESVASAAIALWLICRTPPLAPSPFLSVMWHVVPLMIGWGGYRVVHAVHSRKRNAE